MDDDASGAQDAAQVIADLDRMVHEPARLLILATLIPVEQADFVYLQGTSGLTKGNLSSHLARLEGAGYVRIEKTYRGKIPLTLVSMTERGRSAFDLYRDQLRAIADGLPG